MTGGFGYSYCPENVGFELEYFSTMGGVNSGRPSGGGASVDLIVQQAKSSEFQFFGIGGLGVWAEKFADGSGGVVYAKNLGGGVKIRLAERLRLRLDYRLFVLGDLQDGSRGPTTKYPQRLSVGLQLRF